MLQLHGHSWIKSSCPQLLRIPEKYEKNLKVQKATQKAISEKTKQFMILAFKTGNA